MNEFLNSFCDGKEVVIIKENASAGDLTEHLIFDELKKDPKDNKLNFVARRKYSGNQHVGVSEETFKVTGCLSTKDSTGLIETEEFLLPAGVE
jgi:hypothetical protein